MPLSSVIGMEAGHKQGLESALSDFANIVSHHLGGLVVSIEGFAYLLSETLDSREQRELILRIFESVVRIERVLSDLNSYCSPVEPVAIPLYIDEVFSDLLDSLEDPDRRRVIMESECDRKQSFFADPRYLHQALLVLVQNALEASNPEKSVKIRARIDEERQVAHFEVWNEGTIDVEEPEETIFQPFFTTKAKNLGIGLPIANRIAQAHNGRIYLSLNDASLGTSFTLELPLKASEAKLFLDLAS